MTKKAALILTNSEDVTSDFLCDKLNEGGVRFLRYNTDLDCFRTTFSYKENAPHITWGENSLFSDQVSAVVFRRPKPLEMKSDMDHTTKEHTIAEWSEALEGFLAHIDHKDWINHPASNCMVSHKMEQLTRAKKYGLSIPSTIVTNEPDYAEEFIRSHRFSTVVKPLASGFIEREDGDDTLIYTRSFNENHIKLLDEIRDCPVMFQSRIPKELDVRVTVLDDTMIAVALHGKEEDGSQRLDIRRDNMTDVKYSLIEIPAPVKASINSLLKTYHIRFGALDFGITETGEWFFFEINPNGQWAWLDIYAKTGISKAFVKTLRGY